jgi:ABC-2 type transport system permease protein
MRALALLVRKDLRLLFRDPLGVVVAFALPLLFAVLFGFVFSEASASGRALSLSAVLPSAGPPSPLAEALAAAPGVELSALDAATAARRLREGGLDLYVDLVGAPRVLYAPGSELRAQLVKGALTALQSELEAPGRAPRVSMERGTFAARKAGPFDASLALGMVWGIVCCAAIYGVSLVSERQRRTLERLCTLPVPTATILAAKALACAITIAAVSASLVAIAVAVFGVRPESPAQLALAVLASGLGFGGLTLALAAVSPSERSATGLAWGVLTLLAMIGGGTVPLSQLPPALHRLSELSPFHWAVLAVEGAVWRGFAWHEALAPTALLLLCGALGFGLALRVFREA